VEPVSGDLGDPVALRNAVRDCRAVYHLAASTSHAQARAAVAHATNVTGTELLALAALDAGVQRLVFSSAIKVYGVAREEVLSEDSPRAPDTPYARSKARAEDLLLELAEHRGLPVVVARLGGTFGPGATGWLGLFRAIAAGRFRLIGRGQGRYPAGDVEDVVAGLIGCGTVPGIEGGVYNLAAAEPVRVAELVELVRQSVEGPPFGPPLSDLTLRLQRTAQRVSMRLSGRSLPGFSRVEFFLGDRAIDVSRARRDLGYAPRTDPADSIRRTARWFRERGLLA
jgi:nucleoside-diphosphate-sugar epimerase